MKYIKKWQLKVVEVMIVASVTSVAAFVSIVLISDCQPLGKDKADVFFQMYCFDGNFNSAAALWLQTPEDSVKSFFHDQEGAFKWYTVLTFAILYFFLATWTYGLSVPSGLFIPCLLIGAAWGRLCAICLKNILPNNPVFIVDFGKMSFIGAAAQLGGVVRMTISLTVILIEATGNVNFGLPIMFTLMVAKWVGDFFGDGIYDMHIELQKVPILSWEAPDFTSNKKADIVMNESVLCIRKVEYVHKVIDILNDASWHSGFPVIEDDDTLIGFILRKQLLVLLQYKMFYETDAQKLELMSLTQEDFSNFYFYHPNANEFLRNLHATDREKNSYIDLSPFMNPSPYVVSKAASLPRMYKLFRGLGLRHLVVIDSKNKVVGIITRKDLARFKFVCKKFTGKVKQLALSFS